ncbi:MAG: signal recognition particle-docking protein FtsY [Oscillospiraceae bacterium]|jgi:fused signal recognition particle receptor|nr:signal recognition particle-docking protein FtsY [Oscillospiraceae bacterium]
MLNFFKKIGKGLEKTRKNFENSIFDLRSNFDSVNKNFLNELEEILIISDVGAVAASEICNQIEKRAKKEKIKNFENFKNILRETIVEILGENKGLNFSSKPGIILVVGVNGGGKTTSTGKLASFLKKRGQTVIIGAADTFRAAAIEQLQVWGQRANTPVIKQKESSDPAAVVFDTINAAKSRNIDVVICDTAGRLHNKEHLMKELEKISRISRREIPKASIETLLVLDATTGQNAINQAKEFKNVTDLTGIILTKLDGTAKGGIVLAIKKELTIPVKFIGTGESIDDFSEFSAKHFAENIIPV